MTHSPGRSRAGAAVGYLSYVAERSVEAPGINHQLGNLQCLMREAHALGRLAVLPRLRLTANHNFGHMRDWRWDDYFDLEASRLLEADGAERPLPLVRTLPPGIPPAVRVGPGGRVPAGLAPGGMVERRLRATVYVQEVPAGRGPWPAFRMAPSKRVLALAAPVAEALAARGGGAFAAVHVRRGDRLVGPMRWLTGPADVERALTRLGVRPGATVFLLSDERDPAYWAPLERRFDAVRHTHFAALAALVPPVAAHPDNYLLYEAEKAVMRRAAVRVETSPTPGYERADGFLVPPLAWAAWAGLRAGRRWCLGAVATVLRLTRRSLGERRWAAARQVRDRLRGRLNVRRRSP